MRRKDLREGTAEFKGDGHWSLSEFTTKGSMALRDLGWEDDQFILKKASASADYSVNDDQLKIQRLQGKLLSGTFTGDAQVDNWLHSVPPPQAGKVKKQELSVIGVPNRPAKRSEKTKIAWRAEWGRSSATAGCFGCGSRCRVGCPGAPARRL